MQGLGFVRKNPKPSWIENLPNPRMNLESETCYCRISAGSAPRLILTPLTDIIGLYILVNDVRLRFAATRAKARLAYKMTRNVGRHAPHITFSTCYYTEYTQNHDLNVAEPVNGRIIAEEMTLPYLGA